MRFNLEFFSTSNGVQCVKVYIKRMDLKREYISLFQSKKVIRALTYEFSSMFFTAVVFVPFEVESRLGLSPFCVESPSVFSPFGVESRSVLSPF